MLLFVKNLVVMHKIVDFKIIEKTVKFQTLSFEIIIQISLIYFLSLFDFSNLSNLAFCENFLVFKYTDHHISKYKPSPSNIRDHQCYVITNIFQY
jgi:hypothetical protein